MRRLVKALATALFCLALPALAQQSQRFGAYELHYSVVNSTFIRPEVAASYGITRGRDRAILNLSLREHLADGTDVARGMQLKGRTWDLTGRSIDLAFQEVRETPAIYYIAEFRFYDEEWRHFEVHFRPGGTHETLTFTIKHRMYEELDP